MANSARNQKSPPAESVCSIRTGLAEISEKTESRDALYLFACHVEWCTKQSLVEYNELLAAIDDHDCYIRTLAEDLLARSSSRPATHTDIETWSNATIEAARPIPVVEAAAVARACANLKIEGSS